MMKHILRYLIPLFILASQNPAFSQSFGKNKVNYTPFEWRYIPTENFDIYYTEGGYETALIAAEMAEQHYASLCERWNYTPQNRIPILVYNSHNDFSQTNVITDIIEEGTGGFTELFKNRVVIPWEGSLDKFRHVLAHELTHALTFDMLYGGLIDSVLGREYMFQPPLWFMEGLAEHESQYWSTEGDMIVRDGIINNYLPDINNIYSGYLVYKGGESFFKFIQEEYGNSQRWIAGELLHSMRNTKDVEKSYKSITGKGLEDLSEEWHRSLRSEHWPEVKDREVPDDFATRLTDHTELRNYTNSNPTFNPTGDKIAFLTDRNDYRDIMVMSAIDGRVMDTVVRGESAGDYEEMHWIRGGITWSPDGSMIAFSTKAGERDAIHIAKVEDSGFDRILKPEMDAIYSPDWSPDGSKIAFCGIRNGRLDIFTVDVETGAVTQLTNDFFDEFDPRWSSDGSQIAFASDRRIVPYELRMSEIDGNYDIFIMDADGSDIRQITREDHNALSPDWSPDGSQIVFTSDRNGIVNLFAVNVETLETRPLTNLLTGAANPQWSPDGTKIAFSCFEEGGWDIYLLKRPLQRELTEADITPTAYRSEQTEFPWVLDDTVILTDHGFGQELALESIPPRDYKLKFSPDMFNAFASYNTFMGIGGMGQLSLSDIMGNHRIELAGDLYYSIEESNIYAGYYYLKHQTNWGINLFHYKTYYRSYNWDIFSDRTYGAALIASRPFDRFKRLDAALNWLNIQRDAYTSSYNYSYYSDYDPYGYSPSYYYYRHQKLDGIQSLSLVSEYVNDTTLWGYTGPARGLRYRINIEYSPELSMNDLQYTTVEMDFRRYFRFGGQYNFVTRFSGGGSFGNTPRLFFLGGTDYWLNARISSVPQYIETRQDLFFARFPQPLRGYRYYEFYGNRYFLTNLEFRFPFIQYLAFGWPIPLVIGNINGVIFTDIGAAWEKHVLAEDGVTPLFDGSFHGGGRDANGNFYRDDIKMSWGVGMRMNLGIAVVRLETAWKIFQEKQELKDGSQVIKSDPKPVFYFSIGPEF